MFNCNRNHARVRPAQLAVQCKERSEKVILTNREIWDRFSYATSVALLGNPVLEEADKTPVLLNCYRLNLTNRLREFKRLNFALIVVEIEPVEPLPKEDVWALDPAHVNLFDVRGFLSVDVVRSWFIR